jgi:hypothetical protein
MEQEDVDITQPRQCERCDAVIPQGRLEALPETKVCVKCSEEIGGEFDTYMVPDNMSKVGSLKKNYSGFTIKKVRKPIDKK